MTDYKQPHEDIKGVDRTDTLLSLDEDNLPSRDMIRGLSRHLNAATLVGNPAPVVMRMSDRIRYPQPGDLVIEAFSAASSGDDPRALLGFGILLEVREEYACTDQEWAEAIAEGEVTPEDNRATEKVWYVQYGSAAVDVCRWTNCSFTAIPGFGETFQIPAGTKDGTATVFTRDSLLGSLADSGFHFNPVGGS